MCQSYVVREFAKTARSLNYEEFGELTEQILERNLSLVLPPAALVAHSQQLDSFFPFDPYLLKNSSSFVGNLYNYWKGGSQEFGDSEDEDEDEYDEDTTNTTTSDHESSSQK